MLTGMDPFTVLLLCATMLVATTMRCIIPAIVALIAIHCRRPVEIRYTLRGSHILLLPDKEPDPLPLIIRLWLLHQATGESMTSENGHVTGTPARKTRSKRAVTPDSGTSSRL